MSECLRRFQIANERSDRVEYSFIYIFLRFTCRVKLALRHTQGVVAAFHNVQNVWPFHPGSDPLEKVQRT